MDKKSTDTSASMSVINHLGEVRKRLLCCFAFGFLIFVACSYVSKELFYFLTIPLYKALHQPANIVFGKPEEALTVFLKTAFIASLFISSPFFAYQIWAFIKPALGWRVKSIGRLFVWLSFILFIIGGLFCYFFVLPPTYKFLLRITQESSGLFDRLLPGLNRLTLSPQIRMDEYFDFTLGMLVLFGGVFELPLVLSILCKIGVTSPIKLWRMNRYMLLLFAFIGAIATPGDIIVSQLLMTGVLMVLYNISLVVVFMTNNRKNAPASLLTINTEGN